AEIRVLDYAVVHDCGRLINPMIVEGQITGGVAQGVAGALLEQVVYDADGTPLNANFMDFLMPYLTEVPRIRIAHLETPSPLNPLGAKGLGESGSIAILAALANAVADALGVDDVVLPITPAKISEWIHGPEPPPSDVAAGALVRGKGRMLEGTGEQIVPARPEEVWETLLDASALASLIPGCKSLEATGKHSYAGTAVIAVGPVKGAFRASFQHSHLDPPRALTLAGTASGPLGHGRGEGQLRLEPVQDGTRLAYSYSVRVSGKFAAVGGRMLDGVSRALIRQFFEKLTQRAAGDRGEPARRRVWRWLGLGK
ncbi:MAG: molybdopterin cofactor-binding domain-containing protein, partial [Geminicoccales bacterium]